MNQSPANPIASTPWMEMLNPDVITGRVRHALFDFDGTLSIIRHGWETVMGPMMVEMICARQTPDADALAQIRAEVEAYIDRSTGTLTIKQMKWLAQTVERYGLGGEALSPGEYKHIYNQRLLDKIQQRSPMVDGRLETPEAWTIAGARDFLQAMAERGVELYLASGTDLVYVRREAAALGVDIFFGEHIYGAVGDSEDDSKEAVIRRLLEERHLAGPELLVVGDGPVEIRFARQAGAIALGIAADEARRGGLDERKRQRLIAAGADLIITDYLHTSQIVDRLLG